MASGAVALWNALTWHLCRLLVMHLGRDRWGGCMRDFYCLLSSPLKSGRTQTLCNSLFVLCWRVPLECFHSGRAASVCCEMLLCFFRRTTTVIINMSGVTERVKHTVFVLELLLLRAFSSFVIFMLISLNICSDKTSLTFSFSALSWMVFTRRVILLRHYAPPPPPIKQL